MDPSRENSQIQKHRKEDEKNVCGLRNQKGKKEKQKELVSLPPKNN